MRSWGDDPQQKKTQQVDVAVVGHAEKGQPPLLALGEAKWNEVMGMEHLERLIRIRDLASNLNHTHPSRLLLGAGFTPSLTTAAVDGNVDLIGLDDLYGANS